MGWALIPGAAAIAVAEEFVADLTTAAQAITLKYNLSMQEMAHANKISEAVHNRMNTVARNCDTWQEDCHYRRIFLSWHNVRHTNIL
ncbi:hypothetical protein L249_7366 [Ophiocordyceps polyrhachis-furcata BCC 54312]|uniref:Uncharacterized protein n=1 Tax=Ophiocordyceps polyrhachis-furcata BCC 54312 TaxID=1330021 RepID=A0A367L9R3_9HYPO|nr:hypothetical protein L249_7366 [Ophiocordyceps polyrhachis-furcata BCC 54312]